jgi:hypothetical protein
MNDKTSGLLGAAMSYVLWSNQSIERLEVARFYLPYVDHS